MKLRRPCSVRLANVLYIVAQNPDGVGKGNPDPRLTVLDLAVDAESDRETFDDGKEGSTSPLA